MTANNSRWGRLSVALFGAALYLLPVGIASAATGLEYLATQQQPDGSFGSTPASLATNVQSTAEVLRAYQSLGEQGQPPFTSALAFLNDNTESNTEYLARRIIVNAVAGNDVSARINDLLTRQSGDGGFGDQPGHASATLDTGYALAALSAANYTSGNFVATAVSYLLNKQSAAGGWTDGDNAPSVSVTAQAVEGLRGYRTTYQGVSAALTTAQNFLLASRAAGNWNEPFESATALLAMLPGVTDLSLVDGAVQELQAAQLANGSWVNDPYTTALSLQALHAYQLRRSGGGEIANGAISGYVLRAGSREPIVGAQVGVVERAGTSVLSNGDGFFSISNLSPGQYTLTASKSGYLPVSGTALVAAGQVTLVGTLVLGVGSDTGLVNGKIFDAVDLSSLAGAVLTLSGGTNYLATTDANGLFSLGAVQPGSYTFAIAKTGYQGVSGAATVAGGQALTIVQGLVKTGGFQDSDPAAVSGTVVDAKTGTPIAGAAFDLGGGHSGVTGADGRFVVSAVPRGNYAATLSASGYVAQSYTVAFPAGAIGNLGVLALYAASNDTAPTTLTLEGTVVDGVAGTTIAGATVTLVETGARTTSDASGRFGFSGITLKTFSLTASAGGYQTGAFGLQVAAFGQAAVKLPLSPPGTGTTSSALQGTVRDAQTSAPIANAQLRVIGTSVSATTDASGNYQLSGIDLLRFDVAVSAVGYAQATAKIQLAAPGQYPLNPALNALPPTGFQVVSVDATQPSAGANTTALFTAQVASLLSAPKSALVLGEVLDAAGTAVATLTLYAEGTTIPVSLFNFGAMEVKTLTVPWPTGQLAPGNYTVIVRVVEPGTINRAQPLGQVLAENNTTAAIVATRGIAGALSIDPPLTQAGATTPVSLTALVRNAGNVALAEGVYQLTITRLDTNAVVYTAQASAGALDPGMNAPVSFGTWVPTVTGYLGVSVRAADPNVPGDITDRLYVGDKATGTFTVNRTTVPEATQTVRGRIHMQGVDARTGTSTDPLFALVKEAVRRGGVYTAPEAVDWHTRNRCLGCHIQTQSAFGLASALDKADVDRNAALFLYNTVASSQQDNGSLYISHPEYAKTQSYLGLWALGAWPNKNESFRASYKAAKFLHDRRAVSGNFSYWSADHGSGWWYSDVANTALAVGGFADVLRSTQSIDLNQVRDFALGPAITTGEGTTPLDMEIGPDGAMYVVKHSGSIVRLDPATNAATTVVTGLPTNLSYGLAFSTDGTMYVSGWQFLSRVNADGTTQTIYTSSGYLTDVETGPDGLLYLADYSNHRILRLTASEQVEVIASGELFSSPYGLAFDPLGNLLVTNYGGFDVLKIAPDRTVSALANGLAFRPMWLATTPDGHTYVSTDAPNGLYHINPSGAAETAVLANTLRGVVVKDGRVWVGDQTANTLHELQIAPLDTAFLVDYRAQVARGAHYFLTNYRDNTPDAIVQAMRMIGLAYAREVVTDPPLLAEINTAIGYADTLLRARQRADGGWGHYDGDGSDALVTAMVGIALDYTDPSPSDPQIRGIIQYLLNTQGPDGSWTNANNGLSTRLAATSFVMAYLPRALDRLGGIDTDLHLVLPANVQLANPSIPPTTAVPMPGGGQEYVWQLLGVTSSGRTVEFDLTLANMQLHEQRAVATRAYLEFDNSFTNEKLQVDLDVPRVLAAAEMGLGVATDKPNYQPNDTVTITSTVANVGPLPASGQVLLAIRAPGSAVEIATLPPIPVSILPAGGQQVYPSQWNTGNTLAGPYEVYGRLLDTQGRLLAESKAPLTINVPAVRVATSVTTDKPIYDAWDTANINARIQNVAPNAILAPSRVELTVRSPSGATLFFEARTVSELLPGALRDLPHTLPLADAVADAVAGNYPVELVLKDSFTRAVLSTATTTFQVRRREVQAITGSVSVQSPRVYIGDANMCTETATNVSGGALTNVKLIHQLISMNGGLVVDEFIETVTLPAGGFVHNYFRNVNTGSLGLGDFSCVIKAEIGDEVKTLAFGGFQVVQPPNRIDAELRIGAHGKLLVLLDGPGNDCRYDDDHKCANGRDPHGPKTAPPLAAQRQFLEQLLTNAGWTYTIVEDGKAFAKELKSGAYHAYGLFSEHVKLSATTQKALREAVFRGEGLVIAGAYDNRNQKLNDALGLKSIGTLAHAVRVTLPAGPLGAGGTADLLPGDRIQRIKRTTAETLASYELSAYGGDTRCEDEDNDDKNPDKKNECEGHHPDTYVDAITVNHYGAGKALHAGFDLLALATKNGLADLAAKTLLGALKITHPAPLSPRLGGVMPVDLVLKNRGIATTAIVAVAIPAGTTVAHAGGGQVVTTGTGQTLAYTVDLAAGEEKTLRFSLKLPGTESIVNLHASVTAGNSLISEASLTITVPAVASLDALTLKAKDLAALHPPYRKALSAAQHNLDKASKAKSLAQVIEYGIKATDDLLGITEPEVVQWRQQIDEWLRYILMIEK